jgi:hypothetical protein
MLQLIVSASLVLCCFAGCGRQGKKAYCEKPTAMKDLEKQPSEQPPASH